MLNLSDHKTQINLKGDFIMEKTVTDSDILKAIASAANNVPPRSFGQVGAAMVNLMGGTLRQHRTKPA